MASIQAQTPKTKPSQNLQLLPYRKISLTCLDSSETSGCCLEYQQVFESGLQRAASVQVMVPSAHPGTEQFLRSRQEN